MRTADKVVALLVAGVAMLPATAAAQGPSPDPGAGSPAGTVYELPLDGARGDAAPRDRTPRDGADRAGSRTSGDREQSGRSDARPRSPLRSENGFGSSSTVPGAPDPAGRAPRGDDDAQTEERRSEDRDADEDRDAAAAGATAGPRAGGPAPAADTGSPVRSSGDDGGSSEGLVYGLLGLVVVVGLAAGLATRSRRGSSSAA